ncbi:hypothetical protein H4R20_006069 [Coemansia guatemalensis]|uniref:NmrA-like domain-containing protein n=1 Tax=Coemansia guatemalensis TaxID=2761395 RepID=A0A9W8LQJ7_9FUNG|nr:hypothetical protein H4R20_006069 [Coemansia guatemalensis]
MTKVVAIVGATGRQGGSVLRTLHASRSYKLRALSRNPNSDTARSIALECPGVEWMQADLNDKASLHRAFTGMDVVFGMTSFLDPELVARIRAGDVDAEFDQGKNIVDAAIAEGVKLLVYSGLDSMERLSGGKYPGAIQFEGKYKTQKYLLDRASRIQGVVIYLATHMQNYIHPRFSRISSVDNQTIEFTFPYHPTAQLPLVDPTTDTGPVVQYILDHPDEFSGAPVEVCGGYYSVADMVNAYVQATGKPARYVQIPFEDVGPDDLVQMFKGISEFGHYDGKGDFVELYKKISHRFTTLAEFWKSSSWTGPVHNKLPPVDQ